MTRVKELERLLTELYVGVLCHLPDFGGEATQHVLDVVLEAAEGGKVGSVSRYRPRTPPIAKGESSSNPIIRF